MKKVLLIIMSLLLSTQVFATDIAFKIGEENILINGNVVKVTAPFEANGTTLVPIRVISEAFGAKVEWDDSTKTIEVSKNDMKITMQIDNSNANINGKEEKILCAPRLVGDSTMVPLRLISETLGATVNYDDATREIKVAKEEEPIENGLTKFTNKELNWSINIPSDYKIDERIKNEISFYKDGMKTRLTVDVYNKIASENLDIVTTNEISNLKRIYTGRNFVLTNGQKIFKNFMTENISYSLNNEDLVFNATEMIFFSGNYKYKIQSYIETKDTTEMAKEKDILQNAVNSFKADLISEKISTEYDENYMKKYTNDIDGYTVGVPTSWTVDATNHIKYVLNDSVNKFKVDLLCIDYMKMNYMDKLREYQLPTILSSSNVGKDLDVIFNKVFENKGGMKLKEAVVSNGGYGLPHTKYYKVVLPSITVDFCGKNDVYIFDVDDKAIKIEGTKKDQNAIDDAYLRNMDKMKKASICYVFSKDSYLFVADCYLSDYYSYLYNKEMYDKIIKSILE